MSQKVGVVLVPGSLSLIFHLKVNGHASNYLLSNYTNGTRFMYKHITHLKTISLDRGSDSIINKSINVARRSMKGLLFYERYAAGARDSEKTFNPDITEVKVIVNGSRIRFTAKEWRQEICEKRSSEDLERKTARWMRQTYAGDSFALFIDLRSMRVNHLHGSGLRVMNTKEGVQLAIKRKASGSGNVKCHIFIPRMLSSTSSTESLKAWPINDISHHHTAKQNLFSNSLKKGSNEIFLFQFIPYVFPNILNIIFYSY